MARLVCPAQATTTSLLARAFVLLLVWSGSGLSSDLPEFALHRHRLAASVLSCGGLLRLPIASSVGLEEYAAKKTGDDEHSVESMLLLLHQISARQTSVRAVRTHAKLSEILGGDTEGARQADRLMRNTRGKKKWADGSNFNGMLEEAKLQASQQTEARLGALREVATATEPKSAAYVTTASREVDDDAEVANLLTKILDGLD